MGVLEKALVATIEAEPIEAKVKRAVRAGDFTPGCWSAVGSMPCMCAPMRPG